WMKSSIARNPRSRRETEAVTHPRFGNQILRIGRVFLDLLSKLVNKDSQVFDLTAVIRAPHGLQQFRVRNRHIRMRHEILQQVKLFRRQPRFPSSNSDTAQVEIDFEIFKSKDLSLTRNLRRSSKRCANPCEQFR